MKTLLILIVCMAAQSQANAQPDIEDRNQRGSSVEVTSHPEEKAISRNLIRAGATCNVNSYGRILHIGNQSDGKLADHVLGLLDGTPALRGIWFRDVASDKIMSHLKLVVLPRLEAINLTGSPITDKSLEQFKRFPTLQWSNLERTKITDNGLAHLEGMPNILGLRLNGTAITDAGLASLATLPKLRHLELEDTAVTDAGMKHLAKIKTLKTLYLRRTKITDKALATLQGMQSLYALALDGNPITDTGLAEFAKDVGLQRVQHLYLHNTLVTDKGVRYLDAIHKLQGVALQGTKVTAASIHHLKKRPELYWITKPINIKLDDEP